MSHMCRLIWGYIYRYTPRRYAPVAQPVVKCKRSYLIRVQCAWLQLAVMRHRDATKKFQKIQKTIIVHSTMHNMASNSNNENY